MANLIFQIHFIILHGFVCVRLQYIAEEDYFEVYDLGLSIVSGYLLVSLHNTYK